MIEQGYEYFSVEPTKNEWQRYLTEKLGLGYSQIKINRSYSAWPKTTNTKLATRLKKLVRRQAKELNGSTAYGIVKKILNNVKQAFLNKDMLTIDELEIALFFTAMERRTDETELSKHLLLEGTAGTGKTLLAKLLFPDNRASTMPNDAKGVGQMEMATGHRILKVDDARDAFWNNSEILSAIYTMHQNTWQAKIHSSKQQNAAAVTVITSNNEHNLAKIAEVCDLQGAKRRFIVAQFDGGLTLEQRYKITATTCEDLLEYFFSIFKYRKWNIKQPVIKQMYELLKEMADEEDGSGNEVEETNDKETVTTSVIDAIKGMEVDKPSPDPTWKALQYEPLSDEEVEKELTSYNNNTTELDNNNGLPITSLEELRDVMKSLEKHTQLANIELRLTTSIGGGEGEYSTSTDQEKKTAGTSHLDLGFPNWGA